MKKETVILRLNKYGNELFKDQICVQQEYIVSQVTECKKLLLTETWIDLGEKVREKIERLDQETKILIEANNFIFTVDQDMHYHKLVFSRKVYRKFAELIAASVRSAKSARQLRTPYGY